MANELQQFQRIASSLTHGDLKTTEDVPCPYCGKMTLDYSFTIIEVPDRFGFYLVCQSCRHSLHLNMSSRPPNFRDDQVKAHYQNLEDDAIGKAKKHLLSIKQRHRPEH